MSLSRLKIVDITKLQNFYFFTKGLVQTSGQKIEVSWPCFFWLNLLKERVQKRSWPKSCSTLQISWYLEVEKFALFAKGLVHDFNQKFEVSLISLYSAKLLKKKCLAMFLIENELFDKNNIDIRKLQNLHFLQRG